MHQGKVETMAEINIERKDSTANASNPAGSLSGTQHQDFKRQEKEFELYIETCVRVLFTSSPLQAKPSLV